jgi:hypothetical protein
MQNLEEQKMPRWPYLWNPPLDHVDFWIYCSYPLNKPLTCLVYKKILSYTRDPKNTISNTQPHLYATLTSTKHPNIKPYTSLNLSPKTSRLLGLLPSPQPHFPVKPNMIPTRTIRST